MNKKLRVLFCTLFAIVAMCTLALAGFSLNCSASSSSSTESESSSVVDTGNSSTDTGTSDTGTSDTGASDTGSSNTGTSDTGSSDTTSSDTGSSDTTSTDSGSASSGDDTPGTDTPETDDTITVTFTTAYDSDYSWYYATSTYTATASGSYTVAITSPESTTAYVYVYVNGNYTSFAYQTDTDNVTVAAGDVLTFYLYDSYAEAVGEYTVTLTEYEVTATIPTALTIPGDTVASLDSTGYEYDLYYTVTDDTAGEYTFTLSGDTLTDVTVYIYNGYTYVATLTSTNTTATAIFASGAELNVTASVPSTTTTAIAFTLKTEIDTTAETRTGYYEADPVYLYSYTGYNYDNNFAVTTSDSLYFKITGSYYSSLDLVFTATSTDSTFKVYGFYSGDATTEYAELTLTDGSYSFTLDARASEYIMIVPSVAGTINVTLAEKAEEVSYNITEDGNTWTLANTALGISGTAYTFTVVDGGTYTFTADSAADLNISSDNSSSAFYIAVDLGIYSDVYTTTVTLIKGETLTITAYDDSTLAIAYGDGSSSSDEPTTSYTAIVLDTETTITGADIYQFTADEDGTYVFTIGDDDSDIVVTDDLVYSYYGDVYEDIYGSAGNSASITLTEGKTVYLYNYYGEDDSSITGKITITKKVEVVAKDGYYNVSMLTTDDDGYITDISDSYITLSATGTVSDTAGSYDGTLDEYVDLGSRIVLYTSTNSGEKTLTLSVVANSTVTVYYASTAAVTIAYGDDETISLDATGSSSTVVAEELELTAGVTYTFTCTGYAYIYSIVVEPTTVS